MGSGASMKYMPYDITEMDYTIDSCNDIANDFIINKQRFDIINIGINNIDKNIIIGNLYIIHRKTKNIHYICMAYEKKINEILFCFCGNIANDTITISKDKKETYYICYNYICHYKELEFEQWDLYEDIDIYMSEKNYQKKNVTNTNVTNTNVYEEDDFEKCSICFTKCSIGQAVSITICNHVYHEECLNRWFEIKSECPLCRTNCMA
jgi:hypothetical protein